MKLTGNLHSIRLLISERKRERCVSCLLSYKAKKIQTQSRIIALHIYSLAAKSVLAFCRSVAADPRGLITHTKILIFTSRKNLPLRQVHSLGDSQNPCTSLHPERHLAAKKEEGKKVQN